MQEITDEYGSEAAVLCGSIELINGQYSVGTEHYNVPAGTDQRTKPEFCLLQVKTEDESGYQIPKLSSIVLAVDSNWGSEYSCLYRFRVNGSNKRKKL